MFGMNPTIQSIEGFGVRKSSEQQLRMDLMQKTPSVQSHFQFHNKPSVNSQPQLMQHEIVEISSDEDEHVDDGQPESSKGVAHLSPKVKRAVVVEEDNDSNEILNDWYTDLDVYSQFLEPTRPKRQKLDHIDSGNRYGAYPDDIKFTGFPDIHDRESMPTNDAQFTQLNISFDGLDHGDDRATLAFRPNVPVKAALDPVQTTQHHQADNDNALVVVNTTRGELRLDAPPYYDDPKLKARMYRGPGYEKFSIALGTIPEHQDICDEWDRIQAARSTRQELRRARRAEFARYINETIDAGSSDDDDDDDDDDNGPDESTDRVIELEYLHKIREVLPDIQREFALEKIRCHIQAHRCNIDSDVQIQPDPAAIVSDILESSEYPKQEKLTQAAEPAADGTGVTIEWRKSDKESKTYLEDSVGLLATQFDHVPTHFIQRTITNLKSLFNSYLHIQDLDMNYFTLPSRERPYRRSHNPRVTLEKKYTTKESDTRSKTSWTDLVNELQAAKQQVERDRLRREREKEERAFEEANLEEHKASGDIVECQCCFDNEVPINRAVSCEGKDMHWFCFACVLSLAENQVGSMKHAMTCMDQSGCGANLSKEFISRAIPQRLLDKLAFYQQQSEITAACLEGLEQCPFCDFKAICDPVEITLVFQCQNPDCYRVSCRKCHEDSHLPKTCEEAKTDKRVSARHQVEEARSEAMMRSCPRCKVKIIKEVGCNKMRCGMCGCVMCYVCKADISQRKDGGYGHFSETGAKCALYDKDFDRHEFEADEAEKEAIKRVQAEYADIDEQQLQIETGKVKKVAPKKAELRPDWVPDIDLHRRHIRAHNAANNVAFANALREHRARYEEIQRRMRPREEQRELQMINRTVNDFRRIEPAGPVQRQQTEQQPATLHGALHALHRPRHPLPDGQTLAPPRLPGFDPGRFQRPEAPQIPRLPLVQPQHHHRHAMPNPFFTSHNPVWENGNHDTNVWHAEAGAMPSQFDADFYPHHGQENFTSIHHGPTTMGELPPLQPHFNADNHVPQRMYGDRNHFEFPSVQPPNINHNPLNFGNRQGGPGLHRAPEPAAQDGSVNHNQNGYIYMPGELPMFGPPHDPKWPFDGRAPW